KARRYGLRPQRSQRTCPSWKHSPRFALLERSQDRMTAFPSGAAAPALKWERREGYKAIVTAEVNARSWARKAYFAPRATRWISARTNRSTRVGRFSSSHCLSIGRNISRTRASESSALRIARLADKAPNDDVTAWFASGDSNGSSRDPAGSTTGSVSTVC